MSQKCPKSVIILTFTGPTVDYILILIIIEAPSITLIIFLTPNHQWWHAKWKLSWNTSMRIYTLHAHLCTFGINLYSVNYQQNFFIGVQSEVY